jgi:hypothetical protein
MTPGSHLVSYVTIMLMILWTGCYRRWIDAKWCVVYTEVHETVYYSV